MNIRRTALAIAIALLCVGLAWVMGDALEGLNVPPPPTEPKFDEETAGEPPPIIEPVPELAERRSFWMRMLLTGDENDVAWAREQIRRGGDTARSAVLAAAQRSVRSNPAFVQQALDILLESPREDCYAFARDVLESRDPHAVNRAVLLLGELGPVAEPVVGKLATLSVEREYPIPQYAMSALARIGTDAAREAAMDAVGRMAPAQRAFGYVALAEIGGRDVVAFMREAFEVETEPGVKLAAAEGLVRSDDETPLEWLRAELSRADFGAPHYDGTLRVLALAEDDEALKRYLRIAADDIEADKVRANAIETVRHYPLDRLHTTLARVIADANSVDARVAAWHVLIEKNAPGRLEDLQTLLLAPGPRGANDRRVAALVLGRVRTEKAAPALIDALGRLAPEETQERGLYLRALALTGADVAAPVIAKAIATDTSRFGIGGVAFDASTVLGDLTPTFRTALGKEIVAALGGKFGPPEGAGLQYLLLASPSCCGDEAAVAVEPYVEHDDRPIREAAVSGLAFFGRRESLVVLRRLWKRKLDTLLRELLMDTMEKVQFRAE